MTKKLDEFIETIARLRAPDGCPWDREQTHKTLGRYLIEESYEVLEAIHGEDPVKLKEELGDLLLQIVLNAQVAKDNGHFNIDDVAESINTKMINRHPHVFGDETLPGRKLDSADQVRVQWESIKENELGDPEARNGSIIDRVPKTLPSLLQALKVSEKAVSQGFEWHNEGEVWDKLVSEVNELREAISDPDMEAPETVEKAREEVELELGDVLFCLVNVARWHKINPEESLIKAIDKFKSRYRKMEEISEKPLNSLSKDQLGELWLKAKDAVAARK
ncbi:MAG: nucleoside triphosphate pyrophosphohydrolase [Candidatus Melainabacteria bacterium]|nr:nucleoside triphosphate pyrophosphohydrolase [Candidatus Melainabacteria bacterium]